MRSTTIVRCDVYSALETLLLRIRAEGKQASVTVFHDELARVPGCVGKASRKLDTAGAIFGEERIGIRNEQVRVEELVGVLVRIRRRRFGAAKVNPVLIPRDDRVDRWVLPGAQTLEAESVLVVR